MNLNKIKEKEIIDKLSDISATLFQKIERKKINLMGGTAGIALFFFYYAKFTKDKKYKEFANKLLVEIFDEINKGFTLHTYAGGLSGIGWVIEHLAQNGFIELESIGVLDDLDPIFYKSMIKDIKSRNYDFLHGALGKGIYFLSRSSFERQRDYLTELVDHLDEICIKEPNGIIKWKSILNKEEGTEGINLSLSHGMASIINFLSKVYDLGYNADKASNLINGGVKYILSKSLDTGQHLSNFPNWIAQQTTLSQSRLAWCYGDLGIGISLYQAGQSLQNREWSERALDVLRHSTFRRDLKENSVKDAGLCHGTAGIAHIYNRAYLYTGQRVFKESSLYWVDQTLKMATFDDGFCGYKLHRPKEHGGWKPELGLLEGIAGIGLMLISVVSDIEPNWDRCLLLS